MIHFESTPGNEMPSVPLPARIVEQLATIPTNLALAIRIITEPAYGENREAWRAWATRELTNRVAPKAVDHAAT